MKTSTRAMGMQRSASQAVALSARGAEIILILLVFQGPKKLSTHGTSHYTHGMAHVISRACNKCGACISECPTGSIIEGKDQFHIDADTCANHAACVAVCPVNAISLRPQEAKPKGRDEEE